MNIYRVDFQKKWVSCILSFFLMFSLAISIVPQTVLAESASPYEKIITDESGRQITMVIIPSLPPEEIEKIKAAEADVLEADVPEVHNMAGVINILENVPAFYWSYGCSPTAAAMLFGYYDRTGYSNMYTGPTNGGVCRLYNSIWGYTSWPSSTCGECPLSATHKGIDGRAINGHVDDYWIDSGNADPDPYDGHWAEHTPDCLADYMGTSQAKYDNADGSTRIFFSTGGDPLYDYTGSEPFYRDGCHGMRLFAESRGYTVLTNFTQYIKGQGSDPNKGFTFADFQAEIDAGRPVNLFVFHPEEGGHAILGYGYDTSTNTIYIHDTWDHYTHTMTWGGAYYGYQLRAVKVIQLEPPPEAPLPATDEYITPSTYSKIPFAIVQSGFTLVGKILDITSWPGMPSLLNLSLVEEISGWVGGPLSWSVDMLAWGLGLGADIMGALSALIALPAGLDLEVLLDTMACGFRTCFDDTCTGNFTCP